MTDQLYKLIDLGRTEEVGVVTEDQLQFLVDNLEEEGIEDQDYYIDEDILSFLAENGCEGDLLTMLTEALDGRLSIDIRYEVI
jgi:processive 1,2-diacylglycerol beta-glucosyltransferase